jgi:hypothetical protein
MTMKQQQQLALQLLATAEALRFAGTSLRITGRETGPMTQHGAEKRLLTWNLTQEARHATDHQ